MRLGCKYSSCFNFGEFSKVISTCKVYFEVELPERSKDCAEGINSNNLFKKYGQKLGNELSFHESELNMSVLEPSQSPVLFGFLSNSLKIVVRDHSERNCIIFSGCLCLKLGEILFFGLNELSVVRSLQKT